MKLVKGLSRALQLYYGVVCSDEQHTQQSHRNRKSRYNLQLTDSSGREIYFSLPMVSVLVEKLIIYAIINNNRTMQPSVDEIQVAVWWYATYRKVILGSSDGDTPPVLSSGGIEI